MPFYDSVHTGYWRVSLNEQYIWSWLRENDKPCLGGSFINVNLLTALVEDRINLHDFKKSINVNLIVQQEYNKLYNDNSKQKI